MRLERISRKAQASSNSRFVTAQELCDLFGLDLLKVRTFVTKEGMPKIDTNKFDLYSCIRWYVQKLKRKGGEIATQTLQEQKILLATEKARKAKLENDRLEYNSLDREEVEKELIIAIEAMKDRFFSLATTISTNIESLRAGGEIYNTVMDCVIDAFNDIGSSLSNVTDKKHWEKKEKQRKKSNKRGRKKKKCN